MTLPEPVRLAALTVGIWLAVAVVVLRMVLVAGQLGDQFRGDEALQEKEAALKFWFWLLAPFGLAALGLFFLTEGG